MKKQERIDIEVIPGITVGKHLIDAAAQVPNSGPNCSERDRRIREVADRETEEMRADIDVSKKIVSSLITGNLINERHRNEAEELLVKDLQRQQDKRTLFVDVTGMPPRDAASRVLGAVAQNGIDDVEPVDLARALCDTRQLTEYQVEELRPLLLVKQHTPDDKLPPSISFMIPNIDLPTPCDAATSDVKSVMARYVHLDSMPPELKGVVRAYLNMRHGSTMRGDQAEFKRTLRRLLERTEETMGPVVPLEPQ